MRGMTRLVAQGQKARDMICCQAHCRALECKVYQHEKLSQFRTGIELCVR